jgi:predicted enzyme related to lactoylglutathione lyase
MFKKLRTVIYHVDNLKAARDWYTNLTGIQPYFDQSFYVGFDINGCELGLDPDMENIKPGNQTVSYWEVEDVATALNQLSKTGAIIIQPKTNVGGDINVAIVSDPFGNTIGLIEGA